MRTLADAILSNNIHNVTTFLNYGTEINQIDEYGFTPLIEAAIIENVEIAKLLLEHGANPNLQAATGSTPLHWAAENNSLPLTKLLVEQGANPNAYNFSGMPVLVMPTLRHQTKLRRFLIEQGADPLFSQDYINTKLLGHIFELVGHASIVDPHNKLIEVDFEGFFLEITLGIIYDALTQFQNHFAGRHIRRYAGLATIIANIIKNAEQLIKFQQYRVDVRKHMKTIDELLRHEPLLIPVGYEGHAITFIRLGDIWVKCDRREDSRQFDHIMFYRIGNAHLATPEFFKSLLYVRQSDEFINEELNHYLALSPITELKIESQVSGNCSWANVEAVIPALLFLLLSHLDSNEKTMSQRKSQALHFFHSWREWNKKRALDYCIQRFHEGDVVRKACNAEILAAILFQRCNINDTADTQRIESILRVLMNSRYDYLLRNYLHTFYFQRPTEEGRRFYELLKHYGFSVK